MIAASIAFAGLEESIHTGLIEMADGNVDSSREAHDRWIFTRKPFRSGLLYRPPLPRRQGRGLADLTGANGLACRRAVASPAREAERRLAGAILLCRYRERLREVTAVWASHHLANLGGCPGAVERIEDHGRLSSSTTNSARRRARDRKMRLHDESGTHINNVNMRYISLHQKIS